ncbi:hypothetical protein C1645_759284 [Glomus cerebriforme]|uniref:Uncharacterized protein n=1 Tax=Glomus cerebriforme TaxID=658196 RepID=A0A397T970_9GLOM|nr:hypothetical protein C1645_759284 [Glomus cerebriforme]
MGVDSTVFYGSAPGRSGIIKSLPNINPNGFGTLMQEFIPKDYLGKRVQLSGFIKNNNVLGWVGMWMRVDSVNGSFDNMSNRPINGTGDWKSVENVLDVPEDTSNLAFGILLVGEGEAWLDECKFEIVDPTLVPTTEILNNAVPFVDTTGELNYPINLSF